MHTSEGGRLFSGSPGARFSRYLSRVLVGQQLKAFFPIHEDRYRPTLYPTSTWSSSSRGAFTFRGHCTLTSATCSPSTLATHDTKTIRRKTLFLYLFSSTRSHDLVHVLVRGHGHGLVLGVVVREADLDWTADLGQRIGWKCDARKVDLPLRRRW